MKMCLAGSSLGDKSPSAIQTCEAQMGKERSLGRFPTLVLIQ
jgi:hypothetical protein